MENATQQIPPGEQVGPYQVVRRLGAGGMGEVYLARHRHLNRDAAIKVLLAEISMNQVVVARFFTEARATAQLRHPNIVEIFDCDILPDGRAYIVMEYLRGESLRCTLDRLGKLAPDYGAIAAITGMVADALQAAHENGIVHRDLKPDNTFLTSASGQRDGLSVKVLDFGIAKLLSGERTGGGGTPTRTGSLIGTPLYMSPEQCRGIPTIDHRADIYSLGCMLFEMVVGQPPFVSEAPGDILMAHMLQNAPPLSSFQPNVPPEIELLAARMLAKDPAERPQSMAEIVVAIEALLGVRRADFKTNLARPAGFPDLTAQAPTQILLPEASSSPRLTPPSTKRGPSPAVAATTPMEDGPKDGQKDKKRDSWPKKTPAGASRQKSSGAGHASPGRPKGAGEESDLPDIGEDAPRRPKWILPVVVIAAVAAVGGITASLTHGSKPTAPRSETTTVEQGAQSTPPKHEEPAPPTDVTVEFNSSPEGAALWVVGEDKARGNTPLKLTFARSSTLVDVLLTLPGYVDKRLSLDASRDRTMRVNLEAREPEHVRERTKVGDQDKTADKTADKTGVKKKKPAGKGGETPVSGGFKAVGD
jgi:eukaryotic-like serine/threonine-protein kinase